jgi:hypothetical protein
MNEEDRQTLEIGLRRKLSAVGREPHLLNDDTRRCITELYSLLISSAVETMVEEGPVICTQLRTNIRGTGRI